MEIIDAQKIILYKLAINDFPQLIELIKDEKSEAEKNLCKLQYKDGDQFKTEFIKRQLIIQLLDDLISFFTKLQEQGL